MKQIQLSMGKFAIVDDEEYESLSKWKWHCTAGGYAARGEHIKKGLCNYTNRIHLMHRVITGAKVGQIVDHKNCDVLDNRKENLRICTKSENGANRGKIKNNKTNYKGVSFDKRYGTWQACIVKNKKKIHIGSFSCPKEAAHAYDKKAAELFGEFARPNIA